MIDHQYKLPGLIIIISLIFKHSFGFIMDFQEISLMQVGTKVQSKFELYRALVVEGGLYLPPEKETSMLFISQICIKEKK